MSTQKDWRREKKKVQFQDLTCFFPMGFSWVHVIVNPIQYCLLLMNRSCKFDIQYFENIFCGLPDTRITTHKSIWTYANVIFILIPNIPLIVLIVLRQLQFFFNWNTTWNTFLYPILAWKWLNLVLKRMRKCLTLLFIKVILVGAM